ncbi:MAG: GC-type dockerin domain-anchored protein [Phycisphaerales bacterium]
MRQGVVLLGTIGGACALAGAGVPTSWTYELLCRSSLDPGTPAFNLPYPSSLSSQYVSLDETGGVAIRVFLSSATETEGIFYGSGGAGGLIITAYNADDPVWSTYLDVRNGRLCLADGGFDGGANVYDTAGTLEHAYPAGGSQGVSGLSSPTMTSDGAICYRADFGFTGDKIVTDEFIASVRTQTLIADTFSGTYTYLFSPAMNDARQIVANTIPASGPSRRIVRFEAGGGATTIAETGTTYNSFVNSTGLAQDGEVAFSARRSADSVWEVVRADGSGVTVIADGSNADINSSSLANFPPVVNSDGWVAFRATDASAATALWVGDGTDLVKLAEYGQLIDTDLGPIPLGFDFGSGTGKQVMNGVIDINDAGQVAFAAFLENGTIGVFVATPAPACPADLDGSGTLNLDDVNLFANAFAAGDLLADVDGNGVLNLDDVNTFALSFVAGCP